MGDESESAGEPSRDRDGDDEPTDPSTEPSETAPTSEPDTEKTSDSDADADAGDASDDADDSEVAVDDEGSTDAESDTGGLEPVDDADSSDADADEGAGSDADDVDANDANADDASDVDDADDSDDSGADDVNPDDADTVTEDSPSVDGDASGPGEASEADGGFSNEMPDGFADDFSHLEDEDEDSDDEFGDLDDGLIEGPDSDQEMPLADHIEEMVRRLAVVFILGGGVALSVFGLGEVLAYVPSTVDIINFLWNQHIPGAGLPGNEDLRPHVYGPLELILTKLKVAGLVGVVVGLPVFVYQSYLFMRPGLYQNERKYYLASVPTSLILAIIGVAFAHFVVLPSIFSYFTSYTTGTALIAFGLAETFNLILILMGYMAIVFQIPLFIMLAIMMNLVTRQWLEDKRLIFWGAFLGLAFLVSPDPTGMAPIIIAITMVTLFEGTLALLRWTGN